MEADMRLAMFMILTAGVLALSAGAAAAQAPTHDRTNEGEEQAAPTVEDLATRPAGEDATVRGGAFLNQPQAAADAAARTDVDAQEDAAAPARARAQADAPGQSGPYAPHVYPHGAYVWTQDRGWVWTARTGGQEEQAVGRVE
jgi:hypothetical protein